MPTNLTLCYVVLTDFLRNRHYRKPICSAKLQILTSQHWFSWTMWKTKKTFIACSTLMTSPWNVQYWHPSSDLVVAHAYSWFPEVYRSQQHNLTHSLHTLSLCNEELMILEHFGHSRVWSSRSWGQNVSLNSQSWTGVTNYNLLFPSSILSRWGSRNHSFDYCETQDLWASLR